MTCITIMGSSNCPPVTAAVTILLAGECLIHVKLALPQALQHEEQLSCACDHSQQQGSSDQQIKLS
jgi:hypothetical protein